MISVTVLTFNSGKYLYEVLEALRRFDEVVVLDSGSTDMTLEIARGFPNVVIHSHTFDGFGTAHNRATVLAKNEWVFSVDSDEVVTPELVQEILDISLEERTVYAVSRHNYYNGKLIKWCGWYPDFQWRLYHRGKTQFSEALVHESVDTDGMHKVHLSFPMKHYSYESTEHFLAKMQSYSSLFAQQYRGKRRSSLCKAILHGAAAFVRCYFFQRGFLGGKEGFVISVYNANTAFYKYLKLAEANSDLL